jgi:hypothetical protein
MRDNLDIEIADRTVGDVVDGKTAVVTDRKSGRAWSGEGTTDGAAATEAVRKFLGDRRSREYVD